MHVNRHVLKQSWYLAGWNYIQYDWRSHDGTYLHTDQRVQPCVGDLGLMTGEKTKTKTLQKTLP